MEEVYRAQVMLLLLQVLPEIAKEDSFALHGGTAINLFVRDMPRLSVDIDLTYVHIEDRRHTLENINHALIRIKAQIEALKAGAQIVHQADKCKLQISQAGAQIKGRPSKTSLRE